MKTLAALAATALLAGSATAQDGPLPTPVSEAMFDARATALLAVLRGVGDPGALFTPAFLAAVPEAKLRTTIAGIAKTLGAPREIVSVERTGGQTARLTVDYAQGRAAFDMGIAADGRIGGLLLVSQTSGEPDLAAVMASVRALPGIGAIAVARLGDGAPQLLALEQADTVTAVGSAFKLAILAELVRAVAAGERRWDDLVTLDGTPLPGGAYAAAAKGTAVPLRELATAMIARSDNSAADVLLALIGRERVEAVLPVIGWTTAARNRPFLSALELFKLKAARGGALGRRYLALDEPGRRALLAGEVAAVPLSEIDNGAFRADRPLLLDLEWFATPMDLVRTMDWLRGATAADPVARAILAANPGIGPAGAARWAYVGYKGGSEPGVIDMTLLLQANDSGWYALSAAWNDPAKGLNEARFVATISRATDLLATPPPAAPR